LIKKPKNQRIEPTVELLELRKGMLVESLAKSLIEDSVERIRERSIQNYLLIRKTVKIPIKREYVERVKSPEVKKFIKEHINDFYYPFKDRCTCPS
jgi:hypothetical protein